MVPLVLIVIDKDASSLTIMSLLISLVAMAWNYIYKCGLDMFRAQISYLVAS